MREREEWRGVCDGWDCALPEAVDSLLTPSDLQVLVLSFIFFYIYKLRIRQNYFQFDFSPFDSFLVYLKPLRGHSWG